ncbi:MAG: hypothetical protein IT385_17550 [Deltaproteobacteria bacterium]|nr:hypothetical protein [Deltaproteobacteria bacterium]
MIKLLSHLTLAGALALLPTPTLAADPDPTAAPDHTVRIEPDPEPEPEHEPEHEPVSPSPSPSTSTSTTLTPEAPPAPRRFEVSATAESTWFVADSSAVTSTRGSTSTPQVRVGWSPLEVVDVYAGYRALVGVRRNDREWDLRTDGDAVVVGARGRLALLPWLAAVAELDLEAMHVDVELEIGSRSAATGDWTFGAVPKLGVEAGLDLGFCDALLRVEGGYAFRAPLAVDDVRLSSEAESVVALDLGTLDLSGPVFAVTLALRF